MRAWNLYSQPDEVRYKEDMAPLGLNFIKLGLNDVLYDPVSKTFYTPNTNQHATMTGNTLQNEENRVIITEKRYNPNRDEKGRFAEGSGNGNNKIKSITANGDGTFTVVREPQSNSKYSPSPQRNHSGIQVKPKTYAKLCGEFNTKYPMTEDNHVITGNIRHGNYVYRATRDEYGSLTIHGKAKI